MADGSILFQWHQGTSRRFRTGVSLHGHTYHSRECLSFIPRYAKLVPLLSGLLNNRCARYKQVHDEEFDFRQGWWTPPLSPAQAHGLEAGQIDGLDLQPIVSLSDHDSILAPLELLNLNIDVPVSVEWSVPLNPSFIHLGIHNLPFSKAAWLHEQMQAFRIAKDSGFLADILLHLNAIREVLIVFNHPLWDEPGIGDNPHRSMAAEFLLQHKNCVHALELNGLRPWRENLEVIQLAARHGLPVISGGDRHDTEPNSCINLTNSRSFSEFVSEIRGGFSEVFFLPSYCTPPGARITQSVVDIIRDHPHHPLGWTRWPDRVFYATNKHGVRSMSDCWVGNHQGIVRGVSTVAHLLSNRRLRPAVCYAFGGAQECRA